MLIECQNCGAPLDVAGSATRVRCAYCKKTSDVGQYKLVSSETPADFKQPQTWTPSTGSALPSVPLDFRPAKMVGRFLAKLYALTILGVLVFGAFIFWRISSAISDVAKDPISALDPGSKVGSAVTNAMNAIASASQAAAQAAGAAGGNMPIVCQGSETMTVSGRVISVAGGTPVITNGNCTLTLVACTLSGLTAVSAEGNSHVLIEGGTLTATGPALVFGGNASADISSATITGEPAVRAVDNAQIRVRGSTLASRHAAVVAKNNAHVDTRGSTVNGRAQ